MATSTRKTSQTQAELQAAAKLVLEQEEERVRRAEMRAERRKRRREKEQLAAVKRMHESIEVIKKCMVFIASVMFIGVVLAVWSLFAVHDQVEKVQAEVEKVQPQVEKVINEVTDVVDEVGRVREALRNPLQSMGSAFGAELDSKLKNFMQNRLGSDD